MRYFSLSRAELHDLADRGDAGAYAELQRRQLKNNPAAAPSPMPAPKVKKTRIKKTPEERKAAKRAKMSPKQRAFAERAERVMRYAQMLMEKKGWFPGEAIRVAWADEKAGKLANFQPGPRQRPPEGDLFSGLRLNPWYR